MRVEEARKVKGFFLQVFEEYAKGYKVLDLASGADRLP
jgi:hypothetical protein